jgi:hypothetical protein
MELTGRFSNWRRGLNPPVGRRYQEHRPGSTGASALCHHFLLTADSQAKGGGYYSECNKHLK